MLEIGPRAFASILGMAAAKYAGKVCCMKSAVVRTSGVEMFNFPCNIFDELAMWPSDEYVPAGSVQAVLPEAKLGDEIVLILNGSYDYNSGRGHASPGCAFQRGLG